MNAETREWSIDMEANPWSFCTQFVSIRDYFNMQTGRASGGLHKPEEFNELSTKHDQPGGY
jgi:hypothetical protein